MTETTSNTSKTTPCICGKRHRAGTVCATAERIAAREAEAQSVLQALRQLPAGVVTLLDTRGPRAKARTLADGTDLVRRYADGCEDTEWGTLAKGTDGEVRYSADHGGGVPNSYGYAAETDELRVVAAEGRVVVLLWRGRARSGSHGQVANPDILPTPAQILRALADGERYLSSWCSAAKAQARLERLAEHRAACTSAELVELDAALESGIIA
ncbi:MAG: hypothetical protein ACYC1Z_14245 [Georgenia sp.]